MRSAQRLKRSADSVCDLWGVGDIAHQEGCAPMMVTAIPQGVFFHETAAGWSQQTLP